MITNRFAAKDKMIESFFSKLWQQYIKAAPEAAEIHSLLSRPDRPVINDHVAFRTFNLKPVNIESLQPFLAELGCVPLDDYVFEEKKLLAKSFIREGASQTLSDYSPLIFLSELEVEKLSSLSQEIICNLVNQLDKSKLTGPEFFYSGLVWPTPTFENYKRLVKDSEYAAWLSVMGMRANHFTILVNALEEYEQMADLLSFLETEGYIFNEAGGKIKGSPDVLLEQCSTMADTQVFKFSDGHTKKIPTCFYEFALRYHDSKDNLYQGFVAANADKIFESTHNID